MGSDTQANALAATVAKPAGRTYVLLLLTLVYTFNHIDRQILVILLEPIKADLKLDDAQLGWLTGLVFAVFYATLGVPIAMWPKQTSSAHRSFTSYHSDVNGVMVRESSTSHFTRKRAVLPQRIPL